MKNIIGLLLIISMFVSATEQMGVVNVQTSMTSAQIASFGRLAPYEEANLGNVLINPASIADISFNQTLISNYQLSSQFDYRHVAVVLPYNNVSYSIAYGSNVTAGFVKTTIDNGRVYDIGTFSSGFDVLHFGIGQKVNEGLFFIDHFYYGFGVNMLSQVIGGSRRSPAFGLDVGMISTSYFSETGLFNRMNVGASVVNALSSSLPEWEYDSDVGTSAAQRVERQIFVGTKFDTLNYTTTFHSSAYLQGFSVRDVMFGASYQVADSLQLRFSTTYDAYQAYDLTYNFGTGILLNRVAGVGTSIYDMSIDYNYTMYPFPRAEDPSHTISVSFLGQSTDQRPTVLLPNRSFSTSKPMVEFSGTSAKSSDIYVYNGSSLVDQIRSDRNGKWSISDLYLDSGYNSITFRSQSGPRDLSSPSIPIVVNYDQTPPTFEPTINIDRDKVLIEVKSNEPLKKAVIVNADKKIKFKRKSDKRYVASVELPENMRSGQPLPDQMIDFDILVYDEIGNQSVTQSVSFFVEPLFPADQTVIYNNAVTVLGYASKHVDQILVNGTPITTDKNNGFSKSVQLNYGKQMVVIDVITKNKQKVSYYARLLCMKRFEDIPKFAKYRRDIEFLATLGYVEGKDDGLFYPEEEMSRRDVTLAIASQLEIEPKEIEFDPFLDITKDDPDAGIISAAVDAGVTFAFADGTFRPDETVTVEDAFKMLNNSGVIDSEEVVINKEPIKRFEFALFFKQIRRYDQRVIYLTDWDEGYSIPE